MRMDEIAALTVDQERMLEENIAWIFAARRSGTTWLGRDLLSYNTIYVHEPTLIDHLALMVNQGPGDFVRRIDYRKHIKTYFFSDEYKNTWQHYLKKLILHRIYAEVKTTAKQVIVKEPTSELDASDIISSSMPGSKIIVLFRDGRDVIDSLLDARQKDGWLGKSANTQFTERQRASFIERRARLWVKQMEVLSKTAESHAQNKRIIIYYEQLRADTENILKGIYEFLGTRIEDQVIRKIVETHSFENIRPELKGAGNFYRSASPGKWKSNFTDDEVQQMEKIMANTLRKLGYELTTR